MEDITSPDLSLLTSLANTPRLLSPEPAEPRIKREETEKSLLGAVPEHDLITILSYRPHLHTKVLTLSHLRRRRLRHNLPRDIVSITKLCRDLQQRATEIPLPVVQSVPSVPHLRSAGTVSVYEQAVAATAAATEDAESIGDIKFHLKMHVHELEVMRGAVFERLEDLFDEERGKVLKMQANCCFRGLEELEVEVNHRIWSGRLRQPLQPLDTRVHVSLVGGRKKRRTGKEREGQPSVQGQNVQGVATVPLGPTMDMEINLKMGTQF